MAKARAEIDIARDPGEVWKVVAAYGDLAEWMPGIDGCDLDGDVRTVQTMGIEVREQLRESDDANRRLSYSLVESPLPLQSHLVTITVNPADGGSHVTWDVVVEPDDLLAVFQPVYEQSILALKKHVEG